MVTLTATGIPPPQPDESTPGWFRLGQYTQRYHAPFREHSRLALLISRDQDTLQLYVSWSATGMPAGATGDNPDDEVTDSGAFMYVLTGLPAPGP